MKKTTIAKKIWDNLIIDYDTVLNEISDTITTLNNSTNIYEQRLNILSNLIEKEEFRNIVVDGIILSDLNDERFFNLNLNNMITTYIKNSYKTNRKKYLKFNLNKLVEYNINQENDTNDIIKILSSYLKIWIIQKASEELKKLNKKYIFFSYREN